MRLSLHRLFLQGKNAVFTSNPRAARAQMHIAFLSDPHVSHYGGRVGALRTGRRKVVQEHDDWVGVWKDGGWRIERRKPSALRREVTLRLIDENGELHGVRSGNAETALIDALLELQRGRCATFHAGLAEHFPDAAAIREGLAHDPTNVNLRFCAAALEVRRAEPDWVVVLGDLTDDSVGFGLILEGLRPFFEAGRLLCIPGNHDLYSTPPLWTPNALRKTEREKRELWGGFAAKLGQPASGMFVRELGEGAVVAFLDSCYPPRLSFSASGLVPMKQLNEVAEELEVFSSEGTLRLVCLHHHVVNLPPMGLGRAPWQPGMRLRNAEQVLPALLGMKLGAVLNGHRHVGYQFKPAGGPLFVSVPSCSLGCRSSGDPYYITLDVAGGRLRSVGEQPISLLEGMGYAWG